MMDPIERSCDATILADDISSFCNEYQDTNTVNVIEALLTLEEPLRSQVINLCDSIAISLIEGEVCKWAK